MQQHPESCPSERERREILETFILAFLPKRPDRHRNLANEVHHVSTTLNRIMLRHFGFRFRPEEVVAAFVRLRYSVFSRSGTWDPRKRKLRPAALPDLFGMPAAECPAEESEYLHVNVDPHVVRALRLATLPLPPNTNARKREVVAQLLERIERMKAERKSRRGADGQP